MSPSDESLDRRRFLGEGARAMGVFALAGGVGFVAGSRGRGDDMVWQIDPDQCMACDHCATHCVLTESAVKAVQCYTMCAMCDLCTGYFDLAQPGRTTAAEDQLCPTGAVLRTLIVKQSGVTRYEYDIDEPTCIGCGKCVEGCAMMNGSLYLQIRHDRCLNCNDCTIATACPTEAFRRIPADAPYLLKSKARQMLDSEADDK